MSKPANTRAIREPAAKSQVSKAVAVALGIGSNRATPGRAALPAGKQATGGKAVGGALAISHVNMARAESTSWRRAFVEILDLNSDVDALNEYRADLNKAWKALQDEGKALGFSISATVGARVSECRTVANAADKGLSSSEALVMVNALGIGKEKTLDTVAHGTLVKMAREWNDTHNRDGEVISAEATAKKRGAKKQPAAEKVKRYILSNVAAADLPTILAMVTSLAGRVKNAKDVQRELAKPTTVLTVIKGGKPAKGQTIERRAAARAA